MNKQDFTHAEVRFCHRARMHQAEWRSHALAEGIEFTMPSVNHPEMLPPEAVLTTTANAVLGFFKKAGSGGVEEGGEK